MAENNFLVICLLSVVETALSDPTHLRDGGENSGTPLARLDSDAIHDFIQMTVLGLMRITFCSGVGGSEVRGGGWAN